MELSTDGFARLPLSVPPLGEQAAIVKYLGHAHARIDRAIAAKRKMIALLEEQKRAIIHQTVTRGLDPSVPLKDSGIPWLGQIPAHWEAERLGWHVDLLTGFPFESVGFASGPDTTRLLRGINVGVDVVRWDDVVGWPEHATESADRYSLRVGDLVLGMDRPVVGSGVRVAQLGPTDLPSLLVQRVARIRPRATALAGWVKFLLAGSGFQDYLAPIFTGISVPHLSPSQIRDFVVPVPAVSEQREILAHIHEHSATTAKTIDRARQEVELLREFRARLTSDVVTGQVDVREIATTLPELTDALPEVDDELDEFLDAESGHR